MIVHLKSILAKANKGKFGIGAFNTSNLETTLGIVRAAATTKSPVIIQLSESTIKYAGLKNIYSLIESIAETDGKDVPIAVHLDHGHDFELLKDCVRIGLSSVHMDASEFPFEQNVKLTKRAVEFAHKHGAWAQGELGSMLGKEGMIGIKMPKNHDFMTDPAKAKEFCQLTGVDTLAVSVGTMHGVFVGEEKLDALRLKKISEQAKGIPLVLHGGSGLPFSQVKQAIRLGVRIINIDTDLRIAFTKQLRETLKTTPKTFYDPRKILGPSIEAVAAQTAELIKVVGSGRK